MDHTRVRERKADRDRGRSRQTVYVADTHEFRVIDSRRRGGGRPLRHLRAGAGAFTYPTDVAFGPDGTLYVSEYGGNDRIQVFGPDGTLRSVIGRFGEGPGEFNRPQSMVVDPAGERIYVADSCNHRIQVLAPDGEVIRIIGGVGRSPGSLHYPYDLVLLEDGSLLVSEFGSSASSGSTPRDAGGAWGSHGHGSDS